jgi:hypothetical protein
MNCKGCHVPVTDDGHGELLHVNHDGTPGTYGCEPRKKGNDYPVAR